MRAAPTLLEPVPPPSPLLGRALRAGFYPSFLTPYIGDDFVGFTSPLSYPDGSSGKHRGSRCLMCVGPSSREKQPSFELGWGLLASSLSRLSYAPSARYGAPFKDPL